MQKEKNVQNDPKQKHLRHVKRKESSNDFGSLNSNQLIIYND
jgi:hypothetical protein